MRFKSEKIKKYWEFCHPTSHEREHTIIVLTALCLLISLVLSFTLWLREERIFAPSPIIPLINDLPFWVDWGLLGAVLLATLMLLLEPGKKLPAIVFPVIFIVWILQDSLRWQPFLYMYAFVFLVVFCNHFYQKTDKNRLLLPFQVMVIGVYFWAGIGKINPYFREYMFPWFVRPILPNYDLAVYIAYLAPVIEFMIGIFLIIPRLRIYGIGLAFIMLVVVLLCLGPLGHNWGMIVWPWNVFLFAIACACFLFNERRNLFALEYFKRPLVILAVVLFWFLPLMGQFGYWGALPSFKLYSGDIAMGNVILDKQENIDRLPPDVAAASTEDGINLIFWNINEFSIAPTPSVPGYNMYLTGARGLCPYLEKPENAYLVTEMFKLKNDTVKKTMSKVKLCI